MMFKGIKGVKVIKVNPLGEMYSYKGNSDDIVDPLTPLKRWYEMLVGGRLSRPRFAKNYETVFQKGN